MAPSWGAWNRIFKGAGESKSVMSSSDGRSLEAVRRGNLGFGNGTVGGGGKEALAEMLGNGSGLRADVVVGSTQLREDLRVWNRTDQLP